MNNDPSIGREYLDRRGAGHALEGASDLPLAEAGEAARLALVGHDAFPTACALVSFFDWCAHRIHFVSLGTFCGTFCTPKSILTH